MEISKKFSKTGKEENTHPEISIFNIKSKLAHNIISSFIPKHRLLKIANFNKKLQKLCDINIEDYEVYHILKSNIRKKFSLSERPLESSLKIMKNIFELTKSELLNRNHTEINVPCCIYSLIQMKNLQIIAATEQTLLVIEFNKKKNTFDILREIKLKVNGVFNSLVDIGNNLLLASTIFQGYVINLDTDEITFEVEGCCPIPLQDGRIAHVINQNILKISKMNEIGKDEQLTIVKRNLNLNEDIKEQNLISDGIELKNGNILLISWDQTITEYDIKLKKCIQVIQTTINYMDKCYELKDGRIGILANDNGNIYLVNLFRFKKDKSMTILSGHNNTVIKILQLENEQIISASFDGKVKIWYKLLDGNFNCAMTIYLFEDYIRDFLFIDDGRILITGDDKTLRALGVQNYIGHFTIEFQPEDKKNKIIKSFQLIDNRIH